MKLKMCIPAVALTLMAAACGTTAPPMRTSTPGPYGTVNGSFVRVGGPIAQNGSQPPPVPLTGTVLFAAGDQRTLAVRVGESGRFSVSLPAGSYAVSGLSPSLQASGATVELPCSAPVHVAVVAHRTVHVSVVCPVP